MTLQERLALSAVQPALQRLRRCRKDRASKACRTKDLRYLRYLHCTPYEPGTTTAHIFRSGLPSRVPRTPSEEVSSECQAYRKSRASR